MADEHTIEDAAPALDHGLDGLVRAVIETSPPTGDELNETYLVDLTESTGASRDDVLLSLWRVLGPSDRLFALALEASESRVNLHSIGLRLVSSGSISWSVIEEESRAARVLARTLVKELVRSALDGDALDVAVKIIDLASEANVHPGERATSNVLIAMTKAGDAETAVATWIRLRSQVGIGGDVQQLGRFVNELATLPRPDLVEQVLAAMEESGQEPTPVLTAMRVRAYQLTGDTERTLDAYRSCGTRNAYHTKAVLMALVGDRRVDDALAVVEAEPNENLLTTDLANVAELVADARGDELEQFLNSLVERELLAPAIVEKVAETLARNQSWRQIASVLEFSETHGVEPLPGTVGRAIRGLARAGDGRLALSVARKYDHDGVKAYGPILASASDYEDRALAIETVTRMVNLGLEPSSTQLSLVANCYTGNLRTVQPNFSTLRAAEPRTRGPRLCGRFVLAVAAAYSQSHQSSTLPEVLRQFRDWKVRVAPGDLAEATRLAASGGAEAVIGFMNAFESVEPFGAMLDRRKRAPAWSIAGLAVARAGRPDLVQRLKGKFPKDKYWELMGLALEYRFLLYGTAIDKQPSFVPPADGKLDEKFPNVRELLLLKTAREEQRLVTNAVEWLRRCSEPPPPIVATALAPLATDDSELNEIVGVIARDNADDVVFRDAVLLGRRRLGQPFSTDPLLESVKKRLAPSEVELDWFASATFPEEDLRNLFRSTLNTHGGTQPDSAGVLRATCRTLAVGREKDRLLGVIEAFAAAGVQPDSGVWLSAVKATRSFADAQSILADVPADMVNGAHYVAVAESFGSGDDLIELDRFALGSLDRVTSHEASRLLAVVAKKHAQQIDLDGVERIAAEATARGLDLGPGVRRAILLARREANEIDEDELQSELRENAELPSLEPSDQIRHIVHDLTNLTGPLFQDLQEFQFAMARGEIEDARAIAETLLTTQESLRRLIDHWKVVADPPVDVGGESRASLQWVMDRIGELLRDRLEQFNIDLVVSIGRLPTGRPTEVGMSTEQLDIVLRNLINNSIKALRSKGRGRIEVASTYIEYLKEFGPSHTAGWLVVTVRDDGPGIAEHHLGLIQSGGVTFDPQGGGLGWGLSLVSRIVESVGGRVDVRSRRRDLDSDLDSFTEFELALPVAPLRARN